MSLFKISPKTLVLGGLAIAAAAGALKNRDRVAGLIGARSSAPEPPRPEPAPPAPRTGDPASPAPSNYDLGGPAANTATKVPAPEVIVRDEDGGIDERAEEEAAAAEAAAIGGGVPEYPGLEADVEADDATRPLMEAGEGESEGDELAEFDLRDEAEARGGETSDAARQIDDVIEAQDNPALGETVEGLETHAPDVAGESPGANGSGGESQPSFGFAGGKVGSEEDPAPGLPNAAAAEAVEDAAEDDGPQLHPDQTSLLEDEDTTSSSTEKPADEGGSEWQTWSGRADQ